MDAINSPSHQIPVGLSAPERSQRIQKLLEPDDVLPQIGSGQRFQMQSYFASIHGDIGWLRDPFQGCPYPGQTQQPGQTYGGMPPTGFGAPFFPGMPPMGCDPMAGGYWQGVQGMLSMQIALMDRMIAMLMLMMQMNQGGDGQPCPCPPHVDPAPPEVDPCPPDVGPVPPDVDPVPPDVDPVPPDVDPCPPDVDPVPPEVDPAPVDPAAQRARQLDDFKSRLLQASPVSSSAVLDMARRSGLSDREGQALTTFLSLGRDATQFNFSQPKMRALLDIFMTSAKADGDVRAVAQALQHYSREVDDLLPEGCFDALLSVAGKPPGNEVAGGASLKQQLTEANGWGMGWTGRGCNMQNDRVVEILDSWATRPPLEDQQPPAPEPIPEPAPPVRPEPTPPVAPEQRRSQAFQQLTASLSTLGNDVSPNTILQTFRDSGLTEAEGEQFITFLSASLGQDRTDDFDFTRQETRDLMQVYAQAAGANGDLRVIARALLQYSEKCDNRLREEAFNALLFAGGNPPGQEVAGAEQLRTTLGEQDGWTRLIGWNGVDMQHSGVIQVLTANAERTTPIGQDTAPPAPVEETPEARARRERNQNLDRFRDDLRTAGNSVNREEVVEISQRSGLGNWEGENLWQFLSNVGPSLFGGNYDFTNAEVLEYVDIYIDAAKSGNIQGAVAALRRYSSSERTNGRNLDEASFDALMGAAGNPPGTPPEGSAQLKRQLEEASGWGWGGVNTQDREVVQILENFQA